MNDTWKEDTGYTLLEWAEYMELIQSTIISKLLCMVSKGELRQDQYDEIIDYASNYIKQHRPDLLPRI